MPSPGDAPIRHLSSFHVESIRLGAASDQERAWAEEHGQTCERCQALVRELDGFREEFATGALSRTRRVVRQGVDRQQRVRRWSLAALLMPLAAAAAFLLVFRTPATLPVQEQGPDIQEKGGPFLGIVVRRGEEVFPARPGARLRPGDQIRFFLKSVTRRYLLIASVDSSGRASIYVPYDGKESAAVTPGDRLEIEGSIVLDRQLGPERIFALSSDAPLAAETVRKSLVALGAGGPESIRKAAALGVPAEAQATFLVEKVAQ